MLKTLAFYLPQFHAIPENDAWWGKGFTEWNNVRAAAALFPGHYQPHVPHADLGYYDLGNPDSILKQHKIALRHGISAFCYYYYNFNGKTLLEAPLRLINEHPAIDNEFCLCWANGAWTRAWYGQSKEILLDQNYSPEHARSFLRAITPYLLNPRYVKVDGKPLLLVFQPEENPLCPEYAAIWREEAARLRFPGLHLVGVEAMTQGEHPSAYGFDAALEFAPDWTRAVLSSPPGEKPRRYDYQATVRNMILKARPEYTRYRCIFPGWDNTPRYKNAGLVFEGNGLGAFKLFAEFAAEYTNKNFASEERFLFINAWNEWGEGCHLEPDQATGYAPLQILRDILHSKKQVI